MIDIKEIAPYLPYNLRVKTGWGKINTIKSLGYDSVGLYNRYDFLPFSKVNPILHPLSDLTNEITVNDETFVPLERLFSSYKKRYGFDFSCADDFDIWCFNGSGEISTETLTLNKYLKLFEWHFDVFGLIERGDAIDINSL